jgi:hypothetical protein
MWVQYGHYGPHLCQQLCLRRVPIVTVECEGLPSMCCNVVQELSSMVWALATIKRRPDKEWAAEFLKASYHK